MEKRAIIVDDEPATCELIEKVLSSAGIVSLMVTKSEEAPEILRRGKFAVAFLDYEMAFPDGPTLARQMRASGSNRLTPIVLISDDQSLRLQADRQGPAAETGARDTRRH